MHSIPYSQLENFVSNSIERNPESEERYEFFYIEFGEFFDIEIKCNRIHDCKCSVVPAQGFIGKVISMDPSLN